MEKRYLIGRVDCEKLEDCSFVIEYYVLEIGDLYSIEIVKEPVANCGSLEDNERITSYPISRTREQVERIARLFMRNAVTPMGLYDCLDDLCEVY